MEDNNYWNTDNYGDKLEQSRGYNVNTKRATGNFLPTQFELLETYIKRLRGIHLEMSSVSQTSHINGHKMWYTHRTPSGCWICELDNLGNYAIDIVEQMLEALPKSAKKLQWKNNKWQK